MIGSCFVGKDILETRIRDFGIGGALEGVV